MKEANIMSAQTPEELADLIDSLIDSGTGHINVTAVSGDGSLAVDTVKSTDICGIRGACQQPTEFFDDED